MTAKLDRLRATYARAVARRKRADERATDATARLSECEEAESRAGAKWKAAEHAAGLHAEPMAGCAACRPALDAIRARAEDV